MFATMQHVVDELKDLAAAVSYGLNPTACADEQLIKELEKSTGRPRKEWTLDDWGTYENVRAHRAHS